ncbi:MAG: PQQ-dependent sugar dehydrogenase [Bacteroidia bacterium]
MNKNYSLNQSGLSKGISAHRQSKSFISSAGFEVFIISLLVYLLLSFISKAQTFPAAFSQVQVTAGISNPTTMGVAPDGRIFVAQQTGELRIVKNGTLLATPFISLSVNSSGERGLLGIAFDPSFTTNNFIYLYYTISSGANNRISRFVANGDVVVPGSEVVVLNLDPLSSATNHNGGTMSFGADGKLYVGIGENANTANAQNLDTYLGKIIRINSDGSVPSGNPYTSGSAQKMRLWSYGLRNPFTLAIQPGTGKLFVNDVGQSTWEEIDEVSTGNLNFGWPTAEGISSNPAFTNPVYSYQHGTGSALGCAITGGAFFNPSSTNYPAGYIGNYFFLDYCGNWIDKLVFNGSTWSRSNFATGIPGSPVGITTGTDGNIYFLSRNNSALYKIIYNNVAAPSITQQPQSITVSQGNAASFTVSVSGTSPFSYQWKKNGTNISGATNSIYSISSAMLSHAGNYSVYVSNTAGNITSNSATLIVTTTNSPPSGSINTPLAGTTYAGGSIINFSGSANDPEDGTLAASAYKWLVEFHHNTHIHPGPSVSSAVTSGSFTIPNSGETSPNVFYRLYLIVTDSQGAKDSSYRDIIPRTSTIILNTNPQGLQVTLDGQPFATPYTFIGVEGMLRTISVSSSVTINNALNYNYVSWSQGGKRTKTFSTPVNNVTYTANFSVVYHAAVTPANTVSGIDYKFYTGAWILLPDFTTLTPALTGNELAFDLSPRTQNDNFAFRFSGYITVPSDGIYTFYTSSDDGSNLTIDNALVVDNDGLHANAETSGQIALRAGKHKIIVKYFEAAGQEILTVSYNGPGISKTTIPASVLSRINSSSFTFNDDNETEETNSEKISLYEESGNELSLLVKIYPTPSKDNFNMELSKELSTSLVKLYDFSGKLTLTSLVYPGNNVISTEELSSGVYMISIESAKGIIRKKIQVLK